MFYAQFIRLCAENGLKPSAVARKLGFSPSAPGRWKNGGVPQSDTIQRIADFFGVSTDYLLRPDAANTVSDAKDSVILQGNVGNNTVAGGNMAAGNELTEQETNLLRVFRALDERRKTKLMLTLFELEDEQNGR